MLDKPLRRAWQGTPHDELHISEYRNIITILRAPSRELWGQQSMIGAW